MRLIRTVEKYYATTPIFYVNAAPHIGHLYSAAIADCAVRYQQLKKPNIEIRFSTGTDEHGTKIQQAAKQHNQEVSQYCNDISKQFRSLFDVAGIKYTHFNRTADKINHFPAVQQFWNKLQSKDCIYKANYSGWYCVSDETFLTETQLTENANKEKVSAESGHPVQWFEESNYMFRLSNYQDEIIRWIENEQPIKPKKFEKNLLTYLKEPIGDISISRPSSRVNWAVPVPNDESQTIYVWLDALINYLASAGYPNGNFVDNWPPQLQVIGKDILKFHGIYWPAFLIAADLELPQKLLVHSHWTVDDQKMSKSRGNVIAPDEAATRYTYEGLRYFLLREGVPHSDGNYSDIKATRILNSELADTFGNLLSRACAKVINVKQIVPSIDQDELKLLQKNDLTKMLLDQLNALPDLCSNHYDSFNVYLTVDEVIKVLHSANRFVENYKPWELRRDPKMSARLDSVLGLIFETLRITSIVLQPVIPEMTARLLNKINISINQRNWNNLRLQIDSQPERSLNNDNAILFKRIK